MNLISVKHLMEPHFEQQFADLIFAFGCSLVKRGEFPQIGHIDRSSVSDQQLGHFIVTVGARVVEGDQTAGGAKTQARDDVTMISKLSNMRKLVKMCRW